MEVRNGPPPLATTGVKKTISAKKPIKVQRQEAVDGIGQIAQIPLMALGLHADVGALGIHWPNISKEIVTLADSQEQIAQLIDPLIKIGPYTALAAAVLPLAMQIAVNHGAVPAGAMGTVPPTLLSAQVEAAMAQAEMEALRQKYEAEQAAQKMKDEIEAQRKQMMESASAQ